PGYAWRSLLNLAEAGAEQVDGGQPPVVDLADAGLGAGPAGAAARQVQPVVDQQPAGELLAAGLHQVDGVHVGEPSAEAGDDGIAAVLFDRAAGQQRPQPHGVGDRGGELDAVPPGHGRGDRRGQGMGLHDAVLSRRPARASRWPARCPVSSAASPAAPSIRLDLRRRRNGMPIRYRPGPAVTPPSWTTRPLRSRTGTSSQDRSGRYPVAHTIAAIWPDRRSRPSGPPGTTVGANRSPADPAQASIVF